MTAPSKNWSNISDLQIDADSPIDATLMAQIRDDLIHLKEWLGNSFTPAQNHDHDGINSANVLLANASVGYGKLKVGAGSFTTTYTGTGLYINTGTVFVHGGRITETEAGATTVLIDELTITGSGYAQTQFKLVRSTSGGGGTVTVYWEYHYD